MTSTIDRGRQVRSEPPQDSSSSNFPMRHPRLSHSTQPTHPRTRAGAVSPLPLMSKPSRNAYDEVRFEPKLYISPPMSFEEALVYHAYRDMQLVGQRLTTTTGQITKPSGRAKGGVPQVPTLSSQASFSKFITNTPGPAEVGSRRPPPLTIDVGVLGAPLGGLAEPKASVKPPEGTPTAGGTDEVGVWTEECREAASVDLAMGDAKDPLHRRRLVGRLRPAPGPSSGGETGGLSIPPITGIPHSPMGGSNGASVIKPTEKRIPNVQYFVNTQTPTTRGHRQLGFMPNITYPNVHPPGTFSTQISPLSKPGPPKMGLFNTATANTFAGPTSPTPESMVSPVATRVNTATATGPRASASTTPNRFASLSSASPTPIRARTTDPSTILGRPVDAAAQLRVQSPAPSPSPRGTTATRSRAAPGRRRGARRGRAGRPRQASPPPPMIQVWIPTPPAQAMVPPPVVPPLTQHNVSSSHASFIQQMGSQARTMLDGQQGATSVAAGGVEGPSSSLSQADIVRIAHTMELESRLRARGRGVPLSEVGWWPAAGEQVVAGDKGKGRDSGGNSAKPKKAEEKGKMAEDVEMKNL